MAVSPRLDDTFKVSVTLKGIDGALEAVGGVLLLLVSPTTLNHIVRTLVAHELSQDPHDYIAHHLLKSTADLSHGGRVFAAVYLLSHGVAKVVLVVALLQRRTWAYPGMIVLLGAFIVYQCYSLAYGLSVGLALLTMFDTFVVWLTWREWHNPQHPDRPRSQRELNSV